MKKTSPTDLPLSVSMTLSSSQSILLPTSTLQTSGDAFWKEKNKQTNKQKELCDNNKWKLINDSRMK